MVTNSSLTCILLGLTAFARAQDVLDLGEVDQYQGRLGNPPSLSGSSIWLSGSDDDGFDVVLSGPTQSQVKDVLRGCGDRLDNNCYQDVRKVLKNSELQLDPRIEGRDFGYMLSKAFRKNGAGYFFSQATAMLISMWHAKNDDGGLAQMFMPHAAIDKGHVLATAPSVIVSAGGQPVVTVQPTPDPTSLQGSQTPHITPVSTAHGPFATGDLKAVMDGKLARRLDEMMRRMTECEDGRAFDAGKKSRRRAAARRYGAAICAAENVVPMVQAGGALNDLLLLDLNRVHFSFDNAAGDVAGAAAVAVEFVQAYAPLLAIPDELAVQLGNYLFALALDTLVENLPLGAENRIQSSLVTTATGAATTTTTKPMETISSCPDPKKSPLACGFAEIENDCDLKFPPTPSGGKARCKEGKYKDCECGTPSDTHISIATVEEQKFLAAISELLRDPKNKPGPEGPKAKCDMDNLSEIPANVFGGPLNNVYHHFCERWIDQDELKMTVDTTGSNKKPIIQLKKIQSRTPPPKPGAYKDHDINLGFKPSEGNKKCSWNCTEAFEKLWSTCTNTGAMSQPMQKSGSLDAGCGVFDYNISPPPPPPTTPLKQQERHCYGPDDFGKHGDIHVAQVTWSSQFACAGTGIRTVKSGDASTYIAFSGYDNRQPIQYNIYWKDGCQLEGGLTEIYPANPLAKKDVGHTECQNMFIDNYKKCNNGGVGGSVQVGCLVYEFKATHDK